MSSDVRNAPRSPVAVGSWGTTSSGLVHDDDVVEDEVVDVASAAAIGAARLDAQNVAGRLQLVVPLDQQDVPIPGVPRGARGQPAKHIHAVDTEDVPLMIDVPRLKHQDRGLCRVDAGAIKRKVFGTPHEDNIGFDVVEDSRARSRGVAARRARRCNWSPWFEWLRNRGWCAFDVEHSLRPVRDEFLSRNFSPGLGAAVELSRREKKNEACGVDGCSMRLSRVAETPSFNACGSIQQTPR